MIIQYIAISGKPPGHRGSMGQMTASDGVRGAENTPECVTESGLARSCKRNAQREFGLVGGAAHGRQTAAGDDDVWWDAVAD